MPLIAVPAMPSADQIAEAEAAVRARIVTDFMDAVRAGNSLGALSQEFLAAQVDGSTPSGPRLTDELAGIRSQLAAA